MINIIVSAEIRPKPTEYIIFGPLPTVYVKYAGSNEEHTLFDYYPDELHFNAQEFIGLTEEQARDLKYKKDLAYLRS